MPQIQPPPRAHMETQARLDSNSWLQPCPSVNHQFRLKWRSRSNQNTMDLSLGFLFCSTDLYFCLCASTILSWWLWLCSRAWARQVDSSSSTLLSQDCFGYSRFFFISIQIVKLFILVLWKIQLEAWWELHWIYRLLWVVYSFSLYWFFHSMNMVYFSIYLCPPWFLSPMSYSYLYIGLLFL